MTTISRTFDTFDESERNCGAKMKDGSVMDGAVDGAAKDGTLILGPRKTQYC